MDEYNQRRQEIIDTKQGAVSVAFTELEDLINKTQLSRQYFGKSHSWLSQRINGCTVLSKSMTFKPDEYHLLAEAFRHIAARLAAHADEIDSARIDPPMPVTQ